ncbi:MAG: DUF6311 domain-containing protein [Devosia sp.]|nr:DUF6311 domain-containing protein [Devosia sp.]
MAQPARRGDAVGFLAAGAFGVIAYFVWAGWSFLDPQNVSWLRTGDRAMHALGWWFYRFTPWGLPIGINPRNGLEISSSVALSDSLPLFAIPFKLMSPMLPTMFQYWGLWFLASMVLQAVFGYAMARELRLSRFVGFAFAACLVVTPAFLWRLPVHMALGGHWVLLAALYLYVKAEPPRRFAWPILLALASAVHAYLLAMVLAVWVAALAQRLWLGRLTWRSALLELVSGIAASLVVLWSAGFFMTSSLGAEGFGFYRLNLDSFLNPYGWSWILPNLPTTPGDYEGQVFPGLGVLALLLIGFVAGFSRLRAIFSPRWLPLLLVVVGMAVFAASNKLVIGTTELGIIPLPPQLLNFASMFRASGRMIWPAGYLAALLAFVLVSRRFEARPLAILAGLALVAQIADTSGQWTRFARMQPPPAATWPSPMQSPLWLFAARHYHKIRAIPVAGLNQHWAELSYFAAFHDMGSDAAYLGRRDRQGFLELEALAQAALTQGRFESDALYVLDPAAAAVARRYAEPDDLLTQVDGFILFARNGAVLARADNIAFPAYQPGAGLAQ